MTRLDPFYLRAKSACHALVLAARLFEAIREKRIPKGALVENLHILPPVGNEPIFTLLGSMDQENLEIESHNVLMFAGAGVAIALDTALHKKFGARPVKPVTELESLRFIVYMVRCAFAHDPMDPTWAVVPNKRVRVSALGFVFDFAALHGNRLAHDLGGVAGMAKLAEAALNHLK